MSFSGTAQRSYRLPNFDELFLSSGGVQNSSLKAEEASSYDAGVDWGTSDFGVKLTGFSIQVQDVIVLEPASNKWQNIGKERSRGLEAEARAHVGRSTKYLNLLVRAGWTRQKNDVLLPAFSGDVDAALSPRELAFFCVDHFLPLAFVLTNELRYQSEQFEQPNRVGLLIPSYYVWNVRLSFKILAADFYAQADNVTRRRYADALGVFSPAGGPAQTVLSPQPERTFWAGVSIQFLN